MYRSSFSTALLSTRSISASSNTSACNNSPNASARNARIVQVGLLAAALKNGIGKAL